MISFKVEKDLKKLIKEVADKECRTLSSFVVHAIVTYLKDHHKIDWHKIKTPPKKP